MKRVFNVTALTVVLAGLAGSPALFAQRAAVPATPTPLAPVPSAPAFTPTARPPVTSTAAAAPAPPAPVVAAVPAAPNPNAPRIQFAETSFNFGKVTPTDKPMHDFVFTNVGKSVLEITDVHPGCGCTTAGTWDRKVEPGQSGKIPLQFNPANFSGPVSKGATVTCNDPSAPSHYLQFQATIWRPIEVQPQYLYFTSIEGEVTNETKIVRIINNTDEPLTLQPPTSSNPSYKTELKTVQPGKQFELHVSYDSTVTNHAGPQTTLSVKTSSTNMPVLTLSGYAMPQPALAAMPAVIQLPAGPLKSGGHYFATIRNNSHTPVTLSDPMVNAEAVTVKMDEVEAGKSFKFTLEFPTNFQAQAGQPLELRVKTTNPSRPVMVVPIMQMAKPAGAVVRPPVQGPARASIPTTAPAAH